jgi:hypothetical protein
MIPEFNDDEVLPPGIHLTTVEEFRSRFVYNIQRQEIFDGLMKLMNDLRTIGCNVIYIDGSYVTKKRWPGDADVCYDYFTDPDYLEFARNKLPVLFMTKPPRAEQKKAYCSDIFPANVVENGSGELFLKFFQQDKNTGEQKGIIKIELI